MIFHAWLLPIYMLLLVSAIWLALLAVDLAVTRSLTHHVALNEETVPLWCLLAGQAERRRLRQILRSREAAQAMRAALDRKIIGAHLKIAAIRPAEPVNEPIPSVSCYREDPDGYLRKDGRYVLRSHWHDRGVTNYVYDWVPVNEWIPADKRSTEQVLDDLSRELDELELSRFIDTLELGQQRGPSR